MLQNWRFRRQPLCPHQPRPSMLRGSREWRILVTMPPHHTGFLRYENPSPSKPCVSAAWINPFFVMTKLVPRCGSARVENRPDEAQSGISIPIARVDVTASANPIYL